MSVEFNLIPNFEMLPIPCLQVVTKTKMEKIILNYMLHFATSIKAF